MKIIRRIWADIRKYGVAILIVVLFYFAMHLVFDVFCPMILMTGFPCPGCGLTRSILFFMQGQFVRSFAIHPLGCFVVLFLGYCGLFRYILGKRIPAVKWLAVVFLIAALMLYAWGMWKYFPHKPPYTYKADNLLQKVLQIYK